MVSPLPVSVCIPVRNEEQNLPACLAALSGYFDEIVVVDSGSTDRTAAIAREAGATVLNFIWNGKFPKKRNWTLRNHSFNIRGCCFSMRMKQVTPDFLAELEQVLPASPHSGYWISFTNWFMDRPLHHGDPFRKLALFRIGSGEYEAFPESWWSHLDMEVHEHPVLQGTTGEIKARLEHHDFRGLKHYLAKHNEYSSWEASRYAWLRQAGPETWQALTPRQRFKYRYLPRWWLGWLYFGLAYILKLGFLDGNPGWTFAVLKRRYFAEVRLKILESR